MTLVPSLRVILRLIAIDLSVAMVYRAAFLLYMISAVLGPTISLMIWRAALASGAELPVDAEYLTTYFVLLGVVSMLTSSWISGFLAESIRDGKLSIWIVRPGSTHFNGIANNLSEKIIKGIALIPLVGGVGWFVRDAIALPSDPGRWVLFTVSVLAAAVMVYAMDVLVGSLAFWLDDVTGIDRGRSLIIGVLRGQLVPLALFPAWAQGFLDLQPFRFTMSFSLELLVGDLTGSDLTIGMTLQVLYAVLFLLGAVWIWRRGLRAYTAAGA
jgi:ABC-2 type transport system permease protein